VRSWDVDAERIYGYAPHKIIGSPITDLCPPNRLDEVPAMLNRIAKGEHVRNSETIQRRMRGRRFNVSLTVSSVKDGDRIIVAASAIARGITQTAPAAHRAPQGPREVEEAQDLSGPAVHSIDLCAWCKRVPDPSGEWYDLHTFITERSGLEFNGGLCPECMDRYFAPAPEQLTSGS
jgi:PAS domain S-box-containing protein